MVWKAFKDNHALWLMAIEREQTWTVWAVRKTQVQKEHRENVQNNNLFNNSTNETCEAKTQKTKHK